MKYTALLTFLIVIFHTAVFSQENTIYGIKNTNYYTLVPDPNDPLNPIEEFDSTASRLVRIDPANGQLTDVGSYTFTEGLNGTGGSIDPYNNVYYVSAVTPNTFKSIDLINGNLVHNPTITYPNGITSFQEWRFNNSDTTIYGLGLNQNEMYLSTIDPVSGVISVVSQNPITPNGYGSGNTTIDPYFMVYYYTQPATNHLVGIDLYDGSIYNDVPITITGSADYKRFVNLVYNCRDTLIYGLIQATYTSLVPDPQNPNELIEEVDSTTLLLGRINSSTGVVTTVSPAPVSYGAWDINGGVTIDPFFAIYYYNTGEAIVGISTLTGLVVSNEPFDTQGEQNVKLLRFYDNCKDVEPIREDPTSTANIVAIEQTIMNLYPNPANDHCTITSTAPIKSVQVIDQAGRIVRDFVVEGFEKSIQVSTTGLDSGIYIVLVDAVKAFKLTVDHTSLGSTQ